MNYSEIIEYKYDCILIVEVLDFLRDFDGFKADRVCYNSQKITNEIFDEHIKNYKIGKAITNLTTY